MSTSEVLTWLTIINLVFLCPLSSQCQKKKIPMTLDYLVKMNCISFYRDCPKDYLFHLEYMSEVRFHLFVFMWCLQYKIRVFTIVIGYRVDYL